MEEKEKTTGIHPGTEVRDHTGYRTPRNAERRIKEVPDRRLPYRKWKRQLMVE